ncbi:hypothetical protein CRUP_035903 [Coryphaenoides rupestris]|nr:hypothetical protein CRUP_035903 [Coryphaenoides rupestris]
MGLITDFFGGKARMLEVLSGEKLSPDPFPCCCCCCLPMLAVTRCNLNWMLAAVLQLSVVRSIVFFVTLVLWTDEQYDYADVDFFKPNLIVNGIIGVSTFLSFYGHLLFYKATKGPLQGHNLRAKFVCIIVMLVLCGLQGGILETLVSLKVVPGTPPFSVQARSQLIYHYAVIVEMFCVGLYARHTFRRVEPDIVDGGEEDLEEEPRARVVGVTDMAVQTEATSALGLRQLWSRGEAGLGGGGGGGGVNNVSYQSDSEEHLCKVEHAPLHCFPFPLPPPSLAGSGGPDLCRTPGAGVLNLTSLNHRPGLSRQVTITRAHSAIGDAERSFRANRCSPIELYLAACAENNGEKFEDCRVPCKQSWDELQNACRRRRIHCRVLNVNKHNFNDYEVEYLCDLKRGKETSNALVQRAKQRLRLRRWEAHLNKTRSHPGRILVMNEVDLEGPPLDFTYINNYRVGQGIVLNEMALGCECKDCGGAPVSGCCPGASLHRMAYNQQGQVRLRAGEPIYECNSRCHCGAECSNRVVQHGIQVDLCIFKTHNGRGWGVRTMQRIKKNAFVMEYVGEIITTDEAEKREGSTYLFDLDYVEDVYTVDAAHQGNISHFVNHSVIDPVDTESTRMDSSFSLAPLSTMPSSPKKRTRVECRCGSDSCRKYLF